MNKMMNETEASESEDDAEKNHPAQDTAKYFGLLVAAGFFFGIKYIYMFVFLSY